VYQKLIGGRETRKEFLVAAILNYHDGRMSVIVACLIRPEIMPGGDVCVRIINRCA